MASLMAAAGLAGGAMSAFGQYQSGKSEQEAQEFNATIAEREAQLIKKGARLDEYRSRKQLRRLTGSQVAAYGSSGVELTGSPLDVIQDTIADAELEIAINKFNAEMGAKSRVSSAQRMREAGKDARTASMIKAGSTLLSSAGNYAGKYKIGA